MRKPNCLNRNHSYTDYSGSGEIPFDTATSDSFLVDGGDTST